MDHRESFQGKAYGLKDFDTFFSPFSTEILDFAYIYCCFHSHTTYCDVLLITYA